jgi:hypothetical protein
MADWAAAGTFLGGVTAVSRSRWEVIVVADDVSALSMGTGVAGVFWDVLEMMIPAGSISSVDARASVVSSVT